MRRSIAKRESPQMRRAEIKISRSLPPSLVIYLYYTNFFVLIQGVWGRKINFCLAGCLRTKIGIYAVMNWCNCRDRRPRRSLNAQQIRFANLLTGFCANLPFLHGPSGTPVPTNNPVIIRVNKNLRFAAEKGNAFAVEFYLKNMDFCGFLCYNMIKKFIG